MGKTATKRQPNAAWCHIMELISLSAELKKTAYCDRDSAEVREAVEEVLAGLPPSMAALAHSEGIARFTDTGFAEYRGVERSGAVPQPWSVCMGADQVKAARTELESWGFVLAAEAIALGVKCDGVLYEVVVYVDTSVGDPVRVLADQGTSFAYAQHVMGWINELKIKRLIDHLRSECLAGRERVG